MDNKGYSASGSWDGDASGKPMICDSSSPYYVIFVGDAGTGKSTIVEKLTGEKNRSSNCSESFTRSSEAFTVPDGSLLVSDTPGSNSRKDRAEMIKCIAEALKHRKVSKIFIVSKAQLRIDSVIDNLRKYTDNFVELPSEVIGVAVTHMDSVAMEWNEEDLKSAIGDELGIVTVIFSGSTTTAETLLPKIVGACKGAHDLTVHCENVEKLFKPPNNQGKIQAFINDEVSKFSMIKEAYDKKKRSCQDRGLKVDLAFETLTYMSDEIDDAKKRMTNLLESMTFKGDSDGDSSALKDGHVLNMVNQLNALLLEIRDECDKYQCKYQCEDGVLECRKCPYCGLVWTKDGCCSEITTCGNADLTASDMGGKKVFATFSFGWENDMLIIQMQDMNDGDSYPTFGCGKNINWKDMAPFIERKGCCNCCTCLIL